MDNKERSNFATGEVSQEKAPDMNLNFSMGDKLEKGLDNIHEDLKLLPESGTEDAEGLIVVDESDEMQIKEDLNPKAAADGERLEKEWANRVGDIIKHTKGDPRERNVQTNEAKAKYLRSRFNRELGDRN